MFRSAVFKLTLILVSIVMTICVGFSALLYRLAFHELQVGFHNQYVQWYDAYQPFGLRQPGTPTAELLARSHHILLELVYFNLMVLGVSALASFILARRTLRPIEAAHLQQQRFTADVSHELRTPLTTLKMETEVSLLDKHADAKDLRSTLVSNLEEIKNMESLVNNLLLLSSMDARKLRNHFTQVEVSEVLDKAIATVQTLAAQKSVTITSSLTARKLRADEASLRQLFIILLENAIKYSPSGATVHVSLSVAKGIATIDIQDQGSGIPAAALPHVFDRFYRADSARTLSSAQGYGLGLSLAKLIADLHNAEIIISSAEGSGTTASVLLPA